MYRKGFHILLFLNIPAYPRQQRSNIMHIGQHIALDALKLLLLCRIEI